MRQVSYCAATAALLAITAGVGHACGFWDGMGAGAVTFVLLGALMADPRKEEKPE